MKRLIIFLIRKRLGVKKLERFYFSNRKYPDEYYFTDDHLIKIEWMTRFSDTRIHRSSGISLNWILDDKCKQSLVKVEQPYDD